jgi:hypothetical protein
MEIGDTIKFFAKNQFVYGYIIKDWSVQEKPMEYVGCDKHICVHLKNNPKIIPTIYHISSELVSRNIFPSKKVLIEKCTPELQALYPASGSALRYNEDYAITDIYALYDILK